MSSENNGDVKLFLDLSLWFGGEKEMTVNQFLTWFASYISTENKDYLKAIVPFFMKEQQQAEDILCSLLERNFLQKRKIRIVGSKISRQTDWPTTYAKAIPHIPIQYHSVETERKLDTLLLGALVYIAEEWKMWLERIEVWNPDDKLIKNRVCTLQKAIDQAKKRGVISRPSLLSPQHRQTILKFVKPKEKEAFLKSLNRWSDYSVNDLSSIIGKIECMIQKMICDKKDLNNLFEATSHLSILKAALECGSNWILVSTELSERQKTIYKLKNGAINFKLGKGNPKHIFVDSIYSKGRNSERFLQLRELAGQSGSGYEPDIVMGFYCDNGKHDKKNPHVIFGDSKRYPKSDIAGAYKSTIASTMVAYGHWGKLEIRSKPCWKEAFVAPVQPFFTLFYVPNFKEDTIDKQKIPEELPVKEFTLEQMQRCFDGSPQGRSEFSDENLNAWFKKITVQVEALFESSAEN